MAPHRSKLRIPFSMNIHATTVEQSFQQTRHILLAGAHLLRQRPRRLALQTARQLEWSWTTVARPNCPTAPPCQRTVNPLTEARYEAPVPRESITEERYIAHWAVRSRLAPPTHIHTHTDVRCLPQSVATRSGTYRILQHGQGKGLTAVHAVLDHRAHHREAALIQPHQCHHRQSQRTWTTQRGNR